MIQFIPECVSTNDELAARLRSGERVSEGDWLIADRQTGGKGRQGRAWMDAGGNFMGSTVVRLAAGDPPPASLALVAGLAVYEAVLPHVAAQPHLRLKWPNDLVLAGAKLAGILLERVQDGVIVGIGVNLAIAPPVEGRAVTAFGKSVVEIQVYNSDIGHAKAMRVHRFLPIPPPAEEALESLRLVNDVLKRIRNPKWSAEALQSPPSADIEALAQGFAAAKKGGASLLERPPLARINTGNYEDRPWTGSLNRLLPNRKRNRPEITLGRFSFGRFRKQLRRRPERRADRI